MFDFSISLSDFFLLIVRGMKLNFVLVQSPETQSLQSLLILIFKAPE